MKAIEKAELETVRRALYDAKLAIEQSDPDKDAVTQLIREALDVTTRVKVRADLVEQIARWLIEDITLSPVTDPRRLVAKTVSQALSDEVRRRFG